MLYHTHKRGAYPLQWGEGRKGEGSCMSYEEDDACHMRRRRTPAVRT
jgi:hypothetical protein